MFHRPVCGLCVARQTSVVPCGGWSGLVWSGRDWLVSDEAGPAEHSKGGQRGGESAKSRQTPQDA